MAETVADIFTEVIIAPAYEQGAVEVLARKKNIRVLVASETACPAALETRQVTADCSLQQRDALDARRRRSAPTGRWPPASPPPPPLWRI